MEYGISFTVAPDHAVKMAEDILSAQIRCSDNLRRRIHAVAKALIDETDELNRSVREIQTKAARIQVDSLSPPEMIDNAKSLLDVRFPNKGLQDKIRKVANTYVTVAEENNRLFKEFQERYRGQLPPRKE